MIRMPSRSAAMAAACVASVALAACSRQAPPPAAAPAAAAPPAALTPELVRNATVTGLFEQPVTFANGAWEGEPAEPGAASRPTAMIWDSAIVLGDFDPAPGQEAAVLMSQNSGGSGEFVKLAVVGLRDGQAVSLGTADVGDRTKLRSVWAERNHIVMDVIEAGPQDAACCPTQLARKSYALEGGVLKQLSSHAVGTLNIGTTTAAEWVLVQLDGQPVTGDSAPTLRVEVTRVAGFGGCNRYDGPLKETAPGEIAVGPLAATKKACPPEQLDLETRFLAQLGAANRYTFLAGQLALTAVDKDGNAKTLLFRR